MAGEIRRAVIRRIANDRRIPIGAAANAYTCMSIVRKQQLCDREAKRQADQPSAPLTPPSQPGL
jgi:hypothetical protein